MPAVSIILPAYNAAATIADTIACVQAQDYTDWELLVIDDGSSDDTLARVRPIASNDERIQVLQRSNGGPSAARNFGLARARGEIIAFLDADDLWKHDKLATHVSLFNARPEIDLSFARVRFFHDDPHRGRHKSKVTRGPLSLDDVLAENPACTASNMVVRMSLLRRIGWFVEHLRFAEDHELMIRAVLQGAHVEGINCELLGYRTTAEGASANLLSMLQGWRAMIRGLPDLPPADVEHAQATYYRYLARHALRTGHPPTVALDLVRRGLETSTEGFFADARRGLLTLIATGISLLLPVPVRRRLLADS